MFFVIFFGMAQNFFKGKIVKSKKDFIDNKKHFCYNQAVYSA